MSGKPQKGPSAQEKAGVRYAELAKEREGMTKGAAAAVISRETGLKLPTIKRYLADCPVIPVIIQAPEPLGPPEELWEQAKIVNARAQKRAKTRGRASFLVDEDKPFGLLNSSDEHLDDRGCDLATLEDMTTVVRETDGLYAGLEGDFSNNFIIRALMGAALKSNIEPEDAKRMIDYYWSLFGDKILFAVGGNHDAWEKGLSGMDTLARMAREKRILYDSDQFFIKLKVGSQTYRLLLRHKWRMNSSYNPTHTCMQATRMGVADEPPDVVVMGHHHDPAITYWQWYGKRRIAIKTGSAKRNDDYAHKLGYADGGFMAPVVIFWPDRHKALVFPDYREGAEYLTYLRGKH